MMQTILYLEDDAALAFVTERSLMKRGYRVIHFSDIASLEAMLPTLTYQYALLDLKVGNENSLGLIQKIKKPDTSVVVLSGYGTVRTAVQAMKLGAINFLNKPSSIDDIIQALTEVDPSSVLPTNTKVEKPSLKALEWEAIQKALDENEGNISAAARQLKMHRRTLQRKLNKKHLE